MHRSARAVLAVACLALIGAAAPGGATWADAPRRGPQLSIAIDDSQLSAAVGETRTYTITVTNLADKAAHGIHVTQTAPPGHHVDPVSSSATRAAGTVTWVRDVKAGGTVTLRSTMLVVATPDQVLRLAAVACAAPSAKAPPLVCATDSDQLPAGAAAASAQPEATASDPLIPPWGYLAGAAIVLPVAAWLLLRLRRRRTRS